MVNQGLHIIRNMGIRYTLYRIRHEIEKRVGVLKKRHPVSPAPKSFLSLEEWRLLSSQSDLGTLLDKRTPSDSLLEITRRITKGELQFFYKDWKTIGTDYDWITNPLTGYQYSIDKHWSEIPDFSKETGDIKFVWEKSRFSYLLTIIRNDFHNDEDHSEFVFSEIESWIDSNPINKGPNWRCSQEISLRIVTWYIALNYYRSSQFLTEKLWSKIQNAIYWSLHHVYHHINFSRIAVRNNHAITETLFLTLSKYLFPFIPETEEWSNQGRKWFEKEIAYQIYDDGSFLQFSMNYHRVVIQLLSLGICITNRHGEPFSQLVKDRAYKSLNFLYQCMNDETGQLPNYGANDGALFFPLSDTDYSDFRPQINALHKLLTGAHLYSDKEIQEEALWFSLICRKFDSYAPLVKSQGLSSFCDGGYYLNRDNEVFAFIKCGKYKDRPSQADNLHLDLWIGERNVLCDSGSFMYNSDEETVRYFMGTESHNTVMLDNNDQMLKGNRFIWYNWSQAKEVSYKESSDEYIFCGKVKCFTHINKSIVHERRIKKMRHSLSWIVTDIIHGKPENMLLRQLWHTPFPQIITFESEGDRKDCIGFRSLYYGSKEEISQVEFSTLKNKITTVISIKQ